MKENATVLIVDDDALVLGSLAARLRKANMHPLEARSAAEGQALLLTEECDLVICDMSLPDGSGIEFLRNARAAGHDEPVLILTAYGSIDNAVQAMREGAIDYLTKPADDFILVQKIRRILDVERLDRENRELKDQLALASERRERPLVFRHPRMEAIIQKVEAVAATRATLLVQGESGTGKTLLARMLHTASDRREGPFVEVSCGSLPDTLLESELFGYEKGAFTGAENAKAGKFEFADGGTLFLDEIGNASPALQVKLLRVLQDRNFERLGSNELRQSDVRLVLATNVDLAERVRDGDFREDLFYRINVVSLSLPPLRERREDVPVLAETFLQRFATEYKKPVRGFAPEVTSFLQSYDWPGNVRELENVIEHAVVLSKGETITITELPPRYFGDDVEASSALMPLKKAMELPERDYILRALRLNGGNRQKTAEMLEVNRTTLFNKMRKFGLFEEEMA